MISLALGGCNTSFVNYTPPRIPQNVSGIYTFSFGAESIPTEAIDGTLRAQIVIDSQRYNMVPSPDKEAIFSYDYKMPPGVTEAKYYFILLYDVKGRNGETLTKEAYFVPSEGEVFRSRLINRYPIQLLSERGPVGSAVSLVGSGFTSSDTIVVGEIPAATTIKSPESLEFSVPALPANASYPVVLRTSNGDLEVGVFRIDESKLTVLPEEIILRSGEIEQVSFQTLYPAPAGGLRIDVTTDVPASIVMPEVRIPEGYSSVIVNVEGGEPGRGRLFVEAPGFENLEVPVVVRQP